MKSVWSVIKQTFSEYSEDKVPRLAASLAYYTVFSLAPLLVIIVAIAGFAFGEKAARGEVEHQMQGLVGPSGASVAQQLIKHAAHDGAGPIATIISAVVLFLGASGVFAELQSSLDTIWEVEPRPGLGIWSTIRSRLLSFAMVLVIGFLLLVSLILSAVVGAMGKYVTSFLPFGETLAYVLELAVSLGVVTLLFAMIFRTLPDAKLAWRDVWLGAFITAVLFTLGKFLLGLYIGHSTAASVYGAAGSLAALLIWIYYSSQILFIGAEFTQVYAKRRGVAIVPAENARKVDEPASPVPADPENAPDDAAMAEALPRRRPAKRRGRVGPILVGVLIGRWLARRRAPEPEAEPA